MAAKIAVIDGAFSSTLTWAISAAGTTTENLTSDGSETSLTSAMTWSVAMTLTAGQNIAGVMVQLRVYGAFTTETVRCALSADNGVTETTSATINVSSIFPTTTADTENRTVVYFKFAAPLATDGGSDYKIGLQCSASNILRARRSGTAGDFMRVLVTDSTGTAPTTGDALLVAADNASGIRTLTMDNNSTTAFGTFYIGAGGKVTWKTDGTTNLRLAGHFTSYVGGVVACGTTSTPIDRAYTATIEMACASAGQYNAWFFGAGNTFIGQSKTSGKDVNWTLLGADATSGATTLTVTADTGWKAGDIVYVAPTDAARYNSPHKTTLASDAGVSTIVLFTGLDRARVTTPTPAEIVNVSAGNIIFTTTNTSYQSGMYVYPFGDVDMDWVQFNNWQGQSCRGKLVASTFDYCAEDATYHRNTYASFAVTVDSSKAAYTNCVVGGAASVSTYAFLRDSYGASYGSPSATFTDCVAVVGNSSYSLFRMIVGNYANDTVTMTRCRWSGSQYGCTITGENAPNYSETSASITLTDCVGHCHQYYALKVDAGAGYNLNVHLDGCTFWGNSQSANALVLWESNPCQYSKIIDSTLIGGTATALYVMNDAIGRCYVEVSNSTLGTWTGQPTPSALMLGVGDVEVKLMNCALTGTSQDVNITGTGATSARATLLDCTSTGAARYTCTSSFDTPMLAWSSSDGTHFTFIANHGKYEAENTTYRTQPPSVKMTPISTARKLNSPAIAVAVSSGTAVSVSAYVRKTSAYGGADPRLREKANPAVGVDADSTLATFSGSADTWIAVTGTSSTPSADGVLEFLIDCDGTTGSVYVDDWTVT